MHLRTATSADLRTVVTWITSARDCEYWTGPRIAFPIDVDALVRAIDCASGSVFALADGPELIAFGQLVRKVRGRGHLARLIVNPTRRGAGHGKTLVRRLLEAAGEASLEPVSLNVAEGNATALALYRKLGFQDATRPADEPDVPGAHYLEKSG